MAVAVMLAGLITVVNVTMIGAVAQLLSAVPDRSFAAIAVKWFGKREAGSLPGEGTDPRSMVDVEESIDRKRRRLLLCAFFLASVGLAFLVSGFTRWGRYLVPWGILSVATSGNLLLVRAYLGSVRRRVERILYETD